MLASLVQTASSSASSLAQTARSWASFTGQKVQEHHQEAYLLCQWAQPLVIFLSFLYCENVTSLLIRSLPTEEGYSLVFTCLYYSVSSIVPWILLSTTVAYLAASTIDENSLHRGCVCVGLCVLVSFNTLWMNHYDIVEIRKRNMLLCSDPDAEGRLFLYDNNAVSFHNQGIDKESLCNEEMRTRCNVGPEIAGSHWFTSCTVDAASEVQVDCHARKEYLFHLVQILFFMRSYEHVSLFVFIWPNCGLVVLATISKIQSLCQNQQQPQQQQQVQVQRNATMGSICKVLVLSLAFVLTTFFTSFFYRMWIGHLADPTWLFSGLLLSLARYAASTLIALPGSLLLRSLVEGDGFAACLKRGGIFFLFRCVDACCMGNIFFMADPFAYVFMDLCVWGRDLHEDASEVIFVAWNYLVNFVQAKVKKFEEDQAALVSRAKKEAKARKKEEEKAKEAAQSKPRTEVTDRNVQNDPAPQQGRNPLPAPAPTSTTKSGTARLAEAAIGHNLRNQGRSPSHANQTASIEQNQRKRARSPSPAPAPSKKNRRH